MNSKQLKLQCIHDIARELASKKIKKVEESYDGRWTKSYNYLNVDAPYYKQAEELLNSGKIFLFLDKNKTGSKI